MFKIVPIGIIIIIIAIVVYIYHKLTKYKFWIHQPVFHIYDIKYYLFPCGIINKHLPVQNKYCNVEEIQSSVINTKNIQSLKPFQTFICQNYLQTSHTKYSPQINNIVPYFTQTNSSNKSFISLFLTTSSSPTSNDINIIGTITTRPLYIYTYGTTIDIHTCYYVDYLCVAPDYRNKNIAPQLIQTHHYYQSHQNKQVQVSLFKREGILTSIVPLCVYDAHTFHIDTIHDEIELNNCTVNIPEMEEINNKYPHISLLIFPSTKVLKKLISSKNLYILTIRDNLYVFKNDATFHKNERVFSCIGSMKQSNSTEIEFIEGFYSAVYFIQNQCRFEYLTIEDISDNYIFLTAIKLNQQRFQLLSSSPFAYFYYNYATSTYNSHNMCIIC